VFVNLWKDNTVLVSESFDQETAAKLIMATREMTESSAQTSLPQPELGMRLYDSLAFRQWQQLVGSALLANPNLSSSGR
jgi:hypothetical protein